MVDQIKPRYRLGTQNMLDLAKDDATKIPERTLFKSAYENRDEYGDYLRFGDIVLRGIKTEDGPINFDDENTICVVSIDGERWNYVGASSLQPLI